MDSAYQTAILSELEIVLATDAFRASRKASELLRHLVKATLENRTLTQKGVASTFGYDEAHKASTLKARTAELLEMYYDRNPQARIRIRIERGRYAVQFDGADEPADPMRRGTTAAETLPEKPQALNNNADPPFSYQHYEEAKRLHEPRTIPFRFTDEFLNDPVTFGNRRLDEVAMIYAAPRQGWRNNSMAWLEMADYTPNSFWREIPPEGTYSSDQRVVGRHIRLAAVGLNRFTRSECLNLIWQRVSWEQSAETNHRMSYRGRNEYLGHPIRAWFAEDDLIVPPPQSFDVTRYNPPLANRFAINMVVVVRTRREEEYVAFQRRPTGLASGAKIEAGISESVHGDRGFEGNEHEIDIINGRPDLDRVARRCLWQEFGVPDTGCTMGLLPEFDVEIGFTGIVLNKSELSPRMTGFIIVRGELSDIEAASRGSYNAPVSHLEFRTREGISDAVPWDDIHLIPATVPDLAWILRQNPLSSPISPECRARLLFYLSFRFGRDDVVGELLKCDDIGEKPIWWPA